MSQGHSLPLLLCLSKECFYLIEVWKLDQCVVSGRGKVYDSYTYMINTHICKSVYVSLTFSYGSGSIGVIWIF